MHASFPSPRAPRPRPFAVAGALATLLATGCGVDHPTRMHSAPPACVAPAIGLPRAFVAPDQALTTDPGQGAGIFVEYASGGHWHLWASCDTGQTGYACEWDLYAQALAGTPSALKGEGLDASDSVGQPCADSVELATSTTTEIDGVRFDLPPGTGIQLTGSIWDDHAGGWVADPRLLYLYGDFGDAKPAVRSGLPGDPIDIVPASP